MALNDVWWSLQPFLIDDFANPKEGKNKEKQKEVAEGTKNAFKLAKKYGIKTAWGTDILFSEKAAANQGAQLAKISTFFENDSDSIYRYTGFDLLKMATSNNAELLRMSGKKRPLSKR